MAFFFFFFFLKTKSLKEVNSIEVISLHHFYPSVKGKGAGLGRDAT